MPNLRLKSVKKILFTMCENKKKKTLFNLLKPFLGYLNFTTKKFEINF